jgi:hypothetical protein
MRFPAVGASIACIMVTTGTIAASELHFRAIRDTDVTRREAMMTLIGPVEYR